MGMLNYNIFDLFFLKKISYDEFVLKIISYYNESEDSILNELLVSYDNMCSEKIDYLVYALFVLDDTIANFDINKYLNVLNKLIISSWHYKHEDIVQLLEKISNFESLNYLYQAVYLRLDYLSWDENYSFEKKCIYAISKIGKQKSLPYLKKICFDDNKILRECADEQMKKIKYDIFQNNEVRAVFDKETIRVYQAYNKLIASEAVQLGTFGNNFKMDRMSWIKPSFLWMMNRCGWASKENQECVLAIDIKRDGFDYILNTAVDSAYKENVYGSKAYWKYKLQHTDIICQWDPERDINGNPLEYRSIQIGLRGEALRKYVQEWIVSIEDITEYVLKLKKMKDMNQSIDSLLPRELIYLPQ